ncbi:MAG: phosphoribosylformylglycinamidine synthase subunit PurL [Armatimonadetes bacterium]|nr:phosphoribosylformylglycinamidine synthase subunit PurL [Armatimonadota bacterium]
MGLRESEYHEIVRMLRREPTKTELGMFAVMWSEHCGYKYSRPVLAAFKKYKEAMEGAGLENAGVVDIGDGLGVTMKVESHNHPSAVEPYQGAATGVGGIIRDILTMGARPIACLNSLRFGPINAGADESTVIERNRYLCEHVVAGIAGYGNCVGVPTVAGEVSFHKSYSGNPLVNAMCVGILPLDEVTTAAASGAGNPVLYLGSATGRDGIHGATFASDTLSEDSNANRPNVQIGDPFAEKLLIEATLEALQTGAVVAIQDMGAAGLTCSTIEMAAKGNVGMDVDLDLVPMREADMSGYELLLSESQERMLAVAEKGREEEVLSVFRKWGLKAVVIGHVVDEPVVTVRRHGEVIASVDPRFLADQCPVYTMEAEVPHYHVRAGQFDPSSLPPVSLSIALTTLLASPELSSKRWVYQQYDQQVQTQTSVVAGAADAAVLSPRGTKKGLSAKIDGNSRYTYLHPRRGGRLAVAEAARNVACTGALPVAATDGLNFGSPEQPHVFWQFREAVYGIAEAAEILQTPVISGNVSFYNETARGEVFPTPLVGILGVMDDASARLTMAPTEGAGKVLLVQIPGLHIEHEGLGASSYLALMHDREEGYPVDPDLQGEARLCRFLNEAAKSRLITAAHDVSEGGILFAAAESAITGNIGLSISLEGGKSEAATWFAEVPGQVLVFVPDSSAALQDGSDLASLAQSYELAITETGAYDQSNLLRVESKFGSASWPVEDLRQLYLNSLESALKMG